MSNVVNFPIIHRPIPIAPEDERDPHTEAIEMFKRFQKFAAQHCGNIWTENVIRAALKFDDSNGWRDRARQLIDRKESKS